MAFFQFRKGRDEQPAAPAPAQTVEQMRRRAMHRLIGAALLVLAGVIGFPLVFDSQPRPIPVDLPIIIPDKNKATPLAAVPASAKPVTQLAAAPVAVAAASAVVAAPAAAAAATPQAAAVAPKPAASVAKAAPAPVAAAVPVPPAVPAKSSEASKAQALLEGKDTAAKPAPTDGKFVVQVGAFSEADKVREVRQKVEGAGLKTYTQVVETKDGSRTRVRVGPFADKNEATRAAERIKKLDLPAAILVL